jgi:hypothetical protein
MISRRFREGLKAFLERTTGTREVGSPVLASAMDEDHFLYDYPIHCDDATWEHIRAQVEAYGKLYGKPAAGTSLRHLFVAGTSDLPDKETAGAARTAAASTRDSRLTERLTATGS